MLNRRSVRRSALMLALFAATMSAMASLLTGCAGAPCEMGQGRICRADGECRCGSNCNRQEDCNGLDACTRIEGRPTEPGVCVDFMWVGRQEPCVPLCSSTQVCVAFTPQQTTCADLCNSDRDCAGGCCVPLQGGRRVCATGPDLCPCEGGCRDNQSCIVFGTTPQCVDRCETRATCGASCCLPVAAGVSVCAPEMRYCPCEPDCASGELCVSFGGVGSRCALRCADDTTCGSTCCLPLDGMGNAVCAPTAAYCYVPPPSPCGDLDSCARAEVTFTSAGGEGCGLYGSYDGVLSNYCGQTAVCRACWWSPATRSYSDCIGLGEIPPGVTVPVDTTHCADDAFPNPPVRVHCTDVRSFQSGFDCLGSGTM